MNKKINKNSGPEQETHGNQPAAAHQITDFNGAALLDENGNEIPITEKMVQKAIAELQQPDGN